MEGALEIVAGRPSLSILLELMQCSKRSFHPMFVKARWLLYDAHNFTPKPVCCSAPLLCHGRSRPSVEQQHASPEHASDSQPLPVGACIVMVLRVYGEATMWRHGVLLSYSGRQLELMKVGLCFSQ
jgi:hypothetical protein